MNTPESRAFYEEVAANISGAADIKSFIEKETFLGGKPFSFSGHEYQEYIVDLMQSRPGRDFAIVKNSQIGISELVYRYFLAKMRLKAGTSVLLSFPTKGASSETFKTRLDPVISSSPRLKAAINNDVDSASVKQFHNESIIYALSGSSGSSSSLISRPISDVLIDECDKQDPDIINSFGTRQTHTPPEKRCTVSISTPTVSDWGIDAVIKDAAEEHKPMTVCEHCGHRFEPDFFSDVVLPGFSDKLEYLTKRDLAKLDHREAYLACPECKGEVAKRDYVWEVEHKEFGVHNLIGVRLNPFIAPFIQIGDLVQEYVKFTNKVEFVNQKLGKCASLKDSSITRENIIFEHSDRLFGGYVLGMDMGKICHILVGCVRYDGTVHVTEMHVVKLSGIKEFLKLLTGRITFSAMVMDAAPYSDLTYSLVQEYERMYSAIYVDPAKPTGDMWKLTMSDKYDEMVRQIAITKNLAMDTIANDLTNFFTFEPNPLEATFTEHLMDMRRVQDFSTSDEETQKWKWVKSKNGNDHFWHTLCYLYMASKLVMAGISNTVAVPVCINKINPNAARARQKR